MNPMQTYLGRIFGSYPACVWITESGFGVNYFIPMYTNDVLFNPEDPYKVLLLRDWQIYEFDLRRWKNEWRPPREGLIFRGDAVNANASLYSAPIPVAPSERVNIYARSTQDASLVIETYRSRRWWDPIYWDAYDDPISLPANTMKWYTITSPVKMIRLRIDMGATGGNVDAWMDLI
jgi:hypothetical protein